MNPKVDQYFEKLKQWQAPLQLLRKILLDCALTEELKWNSPCYTYNNKNLFLLGGFKDNCVLSFIKGVLLEDKEGLLEKPGENSQSARVMRFTNTAQIQKLEPTIKAYIYESIEAEKAGLKVKLKKNTQLELVEELQQALENNTELKTAFKNLTPGRQRAYNMHFEGAKQSKTKIKRIEKFTPRILKGYGMNDCTCGHSKRPPNCDGSHKFL